MDNKWTWLREYMQINNISQGDVAEALKWQKTRISELLGGKRDFPVNKVFPAAKFFNLDLEEFTKYNSGFTKTIPSTEGKKPQKFGANELVKIDIVLPVTQEKHITFQTIGEQQTSKFAIENITSCPPEYIKILIAHGDAMIPTINNNDLIWIDTSIEYATSDGLYLFEINQELFVKRLQIDTFNQNATIISDNPLYPPINISKPEKISTLGKVVAITKSYH